MTMLCICVAGGLGAVVRFLLDTHINSRFSFPVPVGTLVINVLGSLLLGFVTAAALNHLGFSHNLEGPLGTGFCGGFTTFSTASVETVRTASSRGVHVGVLHCLGMALAGVLAAVLGLYLGSLA
ncbi:CrcB family protein [Cutibacterium sp.]|uniref:fluoride efflux transporter FluC n=1 Tax=Cutibacterium sp. TaxID=1912221 RepID=UPI0026DAEFE6|nr:CrcB family protein [Cutibacterium sp.]MDO4411655.1 CrcB family protein [Cutibacterium sp.]